MGKLRAVGYVILSAVLYGCMPVMTKLVYAGGGNSFSVTFYEGFFSLFALLFVMRKSGVSLRVSRTVLKKLVILGVFGSTATVLLLYYSYSRIPAGLSTTLHYIYPVMVTLMLAVRYKEKIGVWSVAALGMAVSGIALISTVSDGTVDAIGVAAALASGCMWAFYMVYLDKSGLSGENGFVVCFYVAMTNVILCGGGALVTGNLKPLTTPAAWILVIAASIVGRVIAGPLLQLGIAQTGSMVAGILSTLEPITSMLLGWVVLGEAMTAQKTGGVALVLGGVILTITLGAASSRGKAAGGVEKQTLTE